MTTLRLSDTTVRMYRKKNGEVSYRLKSFLLVETTATFNLCAYLRDITASLTLPDNDTVQMEVGITYHTQMDCRLNTMTHELWASGNNFQKKMRDCLGKLRIDYHLSFTGHPTEEPAYFENIVPIVVKSHTYKGQ